MLPTLSGFIWVHLSRVGFAVLNNKKRSHWLPMAPRALMVHDEVFFGLNVKMNGANLDRQGCSQRELPAVTADLTISSSRCWMSSVLSALLFPWWVIGFWVSIDGCNRRTVNSIYSVLILFNPIHISKVWNFGRISEATMQAEKFSWTARTK